MTKPEKLPFQRILAIDSTQKEEIALALVRGEENIIIEKRPIRAQDLQLFIQDFTATHSLPLDTIQAIAVYRIADSLTGTRMGITTANTLAWLHNIPIIELNAQTFETGLKQLQTSPGMLTTVNRSLPIS